MSFNWIGEIEEVIFEARLMRKLDTSDFNEDAEFINGLQSHEVEIQRHVPLHKAKVWIRRSNKKGHWWLAQYKFHITVHFFKDE